MSNDDWPPLLTLAQAAALIPGADAGTLKRRIRSGQLQAYRPGKAYLTTASDVAKMVQACRIVRTPAKSAPSTLDPELASAALDVALAKLPHRRSR
jgi:hypothetical protein